MVYITSHPATKSARTVFHITALGITMVALLWAGGVLKSGSRELIPLENIQSIPYPQNIQGRTIVTESLAHTDVKLHESVFGKQLQLSITFAPIRLATLAVGVREDPFWLSYNPETIYNEDTDTVDKNVPRTATLSIPLTDKIQDKDRSIDIMFFARSSGPVAATLHDGLVTPVAWELHSLQSEVSPLAPSWQHTKQFIRSLINREKPL